MIAHKTANAKDIEQKTELPQSAIGAKASIGPRPDLAGLRVKLPNQASIYLIDPSGYRRWVPDSTTYNNLFRDWNGIIIDIDINEVAMSASLTSGAVLAKGVSTAPVYLISNGIKRWIADPGVMDKYYFNWNTIVIVPNALIESIPSGADWS